MAKYTPKKKQNLRRIRRFIKSAEKRGFVFSSELKENLSSYSTQKLKALTPQKLYKEARYSIGGETVSGERGRKIERTISAKKAVETKKRKREEREQREWERIHQDYIENIPLSDYQDEEQYIPHFTDIVLSNIEEMIYEAEINSKFVGHRWETKNNAEILRQYLKDEIQAYGRDSVATACEQAGDEIKVRAQNTLMASSDNSSRQYSLELVMLIRSYVPTINESKEFTNDV